MYEDEKMGYYPKDCARCGETYNGYHSHTCPPTKAEAVEKVLKAAAKWADAFCRQPDRQQDVDLYDAILGYLRSKAYESERVARSKKMDETVKDLLSKAKQKSVRRLK
jgi:hypothetical protein